jgi:exopolysaccharide biosynthesis WecB/TagA/CpsF family protein
MADNPIDVPSKHDLFGVNISAVGYNEALDCVIRAAKQRRPLITTHLAVHGLIEGCRDPEYGAILNAFDIVAPDGQPVRHALNLIHKVNLRSNCSGPELMVRICRRAVDEGIGIYLYGATKDVVEALRRNLTAQFPGLNIVCAEPSVFRDLSEQEKDDFAQRVNHSGAGIVFIGLGCPLQERFVYSIRGKLQAVQICVGAAFDFLSGNKKAAPPWMMRWSLGWAFRLSQEPRRLLRRYLVTNTIFLWKLTIHLLGFRRRRTKP